MKFLNKECSLFDCVHSNKTFICFNRTFKYLLKKYVEAIGRNIEWRIKGIDKLNLLVYKKDIHVKGSFRRQSVVTVV